MSYLDERWIVLGKWIEDTRTRQGVSQRQLAKRAGLSDSKIRELERGTSTRATRDTTLAKLANGLGYNLAAVKAILEGDEEIEMDASGIDLELLRTKDPAAYEYIRKLAQDALDRAGNR